MSTVVLEINCENILSCLEPEGKIISLPLGFLIRSIIRRERALVIVRGLQGNFFEY